LVHFVVTYLVYLSGLGMSYWDKTVTLYFTTTNQSFLRRLQPEGKVSKNWLHYLSRRTHRFPASFSSRWSRNQGDQIGRNLPNGRLFTLGSF
jgi:hypothetical protein